LEKNGPCDRFCTGQFLTGTLRADQRKFDRLPGRILNMMKIAPLTLSACLAGALLACGQKGPLVMPDAQKHKRPIPTLPGAIKPGSGGEAAKPAPASGTATTPVPPAPAPTSPSPSTPTASATLP
jgi:predicted small lipoprotein YifL